MISYNLSRHNKVRTQSCTRKELSRGNILSGTFEIRGPERHFLFPVSLIEKGKKCNYEATKGNQ